ncbi:PREDICTED: uncharacterized protein LOC107097050 [Cyprinodon variegatus]|nr:PREDICTED: uncharacterized protein LOC107097050 [Cyprinodon variegatus]
MLITTTAIKEIPETLSNQKHLNESFVSTSPHAKQAAIMASVPNRTNVAELIRIQFQVFGEYVSGRQKVEEPICDGRLVEISWCFLKRSEATNVTEDTTRCQTRHKMRLPFRIGASQVILLFLELLFPVPPTVSTHPLSSLAFYPTLDRRELESPLYDLKSPLQDLKDPKNWSNWPQSPQNTLSESEEKDESWEEMQLLRAQRGDLLELPLSPFAGDNSLEIRNYKEGGEGEEGWKRNDALTSMAGGLQAVSREKGGFGFRFGRKRRREKGRRGGRVMEEAGEERTGESRKRGFSWEKRLD